MASVNINNDSDASPTADKNVEMIKKLKAKLINEEHRLVLMKKIRQSQTRPIQQQVAGGNQPNNNNIANSSSNSNNSSLINNNNNNNNNKIASSNNAAGQLKKLRQQQQQQMQLQQQTGQHPLGLQKSVSNSLNHRSSSSNNHNFNASLNQTPAHAHQRPKLNTLWNPPQPVGISSPHVGNLSRQPMTTPPNVVQDMRSSTGGSSGLTSGQQSLLMNANNLAAATSLARNRQQQQQQQLPTSFNKSQQQQAAAAAQMLLQKRNSSKTAVQKQLEQTLMKMPNVTALWNSSPSVGISSPHVGNLSRQPITTPPNVVQDMRSSGSGGGGLSSGQQSLLMNANNLAAANSMSRNRQSQQQQQQQQVQTPTFNKSQAAQMLLQKRTAAKSAIQKQLEQTLMQLPQKHVQVGIDFVPNANNIEFVYYVGLEACVDYLTNTKSPLEAQPLEEPFECSTCGTDFTPSWSWKRSNAVCENCVGNHVKKSIKSSQANRIKSVLAKAAKQEQEMDQRIMAEAANVVSSTAILSTPTTSSTSQQQQQHSLLQPVSHQRSNINNTSNISNLNNSSNSNNNSPLWPRINASPLTNVANTNPRLSTNSMNVQQTPPIIPTSINSTNPLAAPVQPAALASLLQMNPQLSALASLMTGNNTNNNNNNNNQFAQVAALLMNQLTMNLWKR